MLSVGMVYASTDDQRSSVAAITANSSESAHSRVLLLGGFGTELAGLVVKKGIRMGTGWIKIGRQ